MAPRCPKRRGPWGLGSGTTEKTEVLEKDLGLLPWRRSSRKGGETLRGVSWSQDMPFSGKQRRKFCLWARATRARVGFRNPWAVLDDVDPLGRCSLPLPLPRVGTLDESHSHSRGKNGNTSVGRGPLPRGFSGGSSANSSPAMQEIQLPSLGPEEPLEEETATHSSMLVGKSHGHKSLAGYSLWGLRVAQDFGQGLVWAGVTAVGWEGGR